MMALHLPPSAKACGHVERTCRSEIGWLIGLPQPFPLFFFFGVAVELQRLVGQSARSL